MKTNSSSCFCPPARQQNGRWVVTQALMSRSARILMEGWVRVPGDSF
ncbi:MAG: hypothetical protein JSS31_01075 [Proteobacteria bacterium]|nr:hypothetical protein [Pseudomonadota bacterium]MBS0492544.1 hypothetical protein [Pseudomonadota bacterium]